MTLKYNCNKNETKENKKTSKEILMKKSSKVLVTLLCSSMLILAACHKEESKSSMASSTPKSSQTMKSEKSSAKSSSKMADKGKSTTKSETKTNQSQEQTSQSSKTTPSQAQTVQSSQAATSTDSSSAQASIPSQANQTIKPLDISAIAAGDYSSLAGTWQNDEGKSVTFGTDGRTIDGSQFIEAIFGGTTQLNGSLRSVAGPGAAIFIIPGGVPFQDHGSSFEEGVHDLDESRDRLMIGQGVTMEFHPLYRVQ